MKHRHNSRRRRHKTAKKHKIGRGRNDPYRNVRFTVKKPSNRLSAWQKFKTAVGLHKPKYPTRLGITSVTRGRKRRKTKKTKKQRRHKNEAGRGRDEWNKLNDTLNAARAQELHAQAEIDKAYAILENPTTGRLKRRGAEKRKTKYEAMMPGLTEAVKTIRKVKENYETHHPDSNWE